MDSPRLMDQVSAVTKDRRDNYGRPLLNFVRIGLLWSIYLQRTITPEDVALMMDLFKTARQLHSHQPDNLLDKLGYVDCADDMDQHLKALGYSEGLAACRKMDTQDLVDLRARLENEFRGDQIARLLERDLRGVEAVAYVPGVPDDQQPANAQQGNPELWESSDALEARRNRKAVAYSMPLGDSSLYTSPQK